MYAIDTANGESGVLGWAEEPGRARLSEEVTKPEVVLLSDFGG